MEKNNKIAQKIFLLAIFLSQLRAFCTKIIFLAPFLSSIEKIAFLLLVAISAYSFLTARFTAKKFIIVVLLLALSITSYIVTDSTTLSYLLLLPLASRGIGFRKIIKTDLLSKISIAAFVLVCYFAHMTENRLFYRDGIIRESYGFAHPNTLGYISIMICLDALFLLKTKTNSIIARILVSIAPLALCILADSRTAQLAIIIALVYSIFSVIKKKFVSSQNAYPRMVLRRAVYLIPIITMLFSFISTRAYSAHEEWAIKLDDALSTRIYLQDYYEKHHDVSLLGEEISSGELNKKALDNGYYRILFNNGVLGLAALLIVIEMSLAESMKKKNSDIAPILILLVIYGLSEWTVFRAVITPFWSVAFADTEKNNEK